MKRSYKDAFPHEKAVEIMRKDSGTHFDPTLIGIFELINDNFADIYDTLADGLDKSSGSEIEELPAIAEQAEMLPEDEIADLEEL